MPLDHVEYLGERCIVAAKNLRRHPWVMLGGVMVSTTVWLAAGFGIRALVG